jgi:hypothetical protein
MKKLFHHLKWLPLVLAAVTVVPLIDWFEGLKDKERLRVANLRRAQLGLPPFRNLWEFYTDHSDDLCDGSVWQHKGNKHGP